MSDGTALSTVRFDEAGFAILPRILLQEGAGYSKMNPS